MSNSNPDRCRDCGYEIRDTPRGYQHIDVLAQVMCGEGVPGVAECLQKGEGWAGTNYDGTSGYSYETYCHGLILDGECTDCGACLWAIPEKPVPAEIRAEEAQIWGVQ